MYITVNMATYLDYLEEKKRFIGLVADAIVSA